jgi:Tfp pilus assembly protein FimT
MMRKKSQPSPEMEVNGFQLIELMIVCLVCLVIAGIGIGQTSKWTEEYRLEHAFRQFSSYLSEIRSLSIGYHFPISVEVSKSGKMFGFSGKNEKTNCFLPLPEGVRFIDYPKNKVTFYPRGNVAPAGTYKLENQSGCIKVVIALSGRIRWERLK